jgi:threonine aldolase
MKRGIAMADRTIDLRSDTVTRPTDAMRESMKNAVVGDDILRDDPTVIELEELTADMLGKEEAMFTVSGTMCNEIAVMVFTRPGDEIIVFAESHIYNLETGAVSAISGAQPRPLPGGTGVYDRKALEAAVQPPGVQRARTSMVCVENTFHLNRGLAVEREAYADTIDVARKNGLLLYMDGARIFNAAAALHRDVKDLVDFCDAAYFCLSKGLAAPIGAMIAGSREFIREARRVKQRLGGGWRQAGVIAAPGIVGLKEMTKKLPEDHENAERLRKGLEDLGILVDRGGVLTNIVNLDLAPLGLSAADLAEALGADDIKIKVCTETTNRMVTHNDIGKEDIGFVLSRVGAAVDTLRKKNKKES